MTYKVKKSVFNAKNVETIIARAKRELEKQDVHENFGQEYVRELETKFSTYDCKSLIRDFDDWCSSYTG